MPQLTLTHPPARAAHEDDEMPLPRKTRSRDAVCFSPSLSVSLSDCLPWYAFLFVCIYVTPATRSSAPCCERLMPLAASPLSALSMCVCCCVYTSICLRQHVPLSDRVPHQVRSEAEFQELLGAMEEEVKKKSAVAVVPRMLITEQVAEGGRN